MNHRPLLLVVLDGWGFREEAEHNAILQGAPFFQGLLGKYPHALLSASGREVGLPLGLMGNSEVGHLNLGAGRTVYMDVTRIDKSIEDGEFKSNGAFAAVMDRVRREGKALHLMGLVSDGGVHASDRHLARLLELAAARGLASEQVLVHAILDGRDTPPRSADRYLAQLEKDLQAAGVGRIASVVGRYWAMDRDKRWDRVQRAYELFHEPGVDGPWMLVFVFTKKDCAAAVPATWTARELLFWIESMEPDERSVRMHPFAFGR